MTIRRSRGGISDRQIDAMQRGRKDARAVHEYLKALQAAGRAMTATRYERFLRLRLIEIPAELIAADPLTSLRLTQELRQRRRQLEELHGRRGLVALERTFVRVGARYAERNRIEYRAWRGLGVPACVLARARIRPSLA